MPAWIGKRVAPLEATRVFSLKGSTALKPPSLSCDVAHIEVQFSEDFVFPLRRVSAHAYDVSPYPPGLVSVSDVRITGPTAVESALPLLPEVSDNLLTVIRAGVVSGKDYRGQHSPKEAQRTLFRETQTLQRRKSGFRKAYREGADGTETTRYRLNIWDLLFPVLKPPVNIDRTSTLDLPNELYPFQVKGVRELVAHECFLLADEMGTGKTVMTSVALRILFHEGKVRRALIVCPKSVLGVWERHLRDWASSLAVTVVAGRREDRWIDWLYPSHVYVVAYDSLRADAAKRKQEVASLIELASNALSFDAVVLDEAHAVKNPSSKRTRAVRRVAKNATYRWALTGTPVQNAVDDLRSIFDILCPSLFPERTEPVSAQEARHKIQPYFLRRRKQHVFPELPAKIRSDEWLELDDAQRTEYQNTLAEGQEEFRSGRKDFSRIHVFALLQKLKQICNFASGMAESPKTAALLDHVDETAANDKKVLVFTQYVEEGVQKLEPLLQQYGVVSITGKWCNIPGQSSHVSREQAIDTFQSDPQARVFLATTRTGGEGITLTAASYVIHFDHWWNPAVAWQAEDRAHRKGQTETVNIYSYWMTDTVEEGIRGVLQRKGLLHEEVIDSLSESDFDDALTIDDLLEVLGVDRGSVRIPESEARRESRRGIVEIYERLNSMDPYQFEHAVKQVFQEVLGFANARVTGRSADGGVDVEATRGTTRGVDRVVVQCKRTPTVGPNVARELLGVLSADPSLTKGFLVTSGRFTRGCRDFCQGQGRLELIDGVQMAKWIQENNVAVSRLP